MKEVKEALQSFFNFSMVKKKTFYESTMFSSYER